MAIITTTITPGQQLLGFEGLGYEDRIQTPAPVLEVRPYVAGETIPSPGAANNQAFDCTAQLQKGYAYVLMDLFVNIAGPSSGNGFPQGLHCTFRSANTGASRQVLLDLVNTQLSYATNATPYRSYSLQVKPTMVMIPDDGASVSLSVYGYNATANDGAHTYRQIARLLQFDITQAHGVALNTPLPTR